MAHLSKVRFYTFTKIRNTTPYVVGSSSLESTKFYTGIVGHLGLVEAFNYMKHTLINKSLSLQVQTEIRDAISEFEHNIADPYFGLKE